METVSLYRFRERLRDYVEKAIQNHEPVKVSRRNGGDFVAIGAEDWERQEETVYILQNSNLMNQIAASLKTHLERSGYQPTQDEVNEIVGV